jgi:cytochrome b
MNATSGSRAEAPADIRAEAPADSPAAPRPARKVLIWDAPVRVFHGLMVLSFAGAYLTAESERWRLAHVTLGYTMAGLLVFRVVWGFVGTRHARFATFVRGPAAVMRYLRGMIDGHPVHHPGHNPAGALAIVAILVLTAIVSATGWSAYSELGGEWLEELHEGAANAMLAVIGVHVAGVLIGSWMHRDNLIGAMLSGRKAGRPEDAVRSAWRSVALLMVAAVLAFWALQWQGAPAAGAAAGTASSAARPGRDDD